MTDDRMSIPVSYTHLPELDSLFLTAEHQYMYLSSSVIKEMGYYDADLTGLLPEEIIPEFRERILQRRKYKEEVR